MNTPRKRVERSEEKLAKWVWDIKAIISIHRVASVVAKHDISIKVEPVKHQLQH